MDRMRKILLSAPGSLPKRPNEWGNRRPGRHRPREPFPQFSQAAGARSGAAEAIIFYILSILPILSKQFP
jgi:hypothetical protein